MTWSCIAVKKALCFGEQIALVSHLFDATLSPYCWLRSYGCQPCKALCDQCLLSLLVYSSSVASSFSSARNKSSGVYLSSAFITAACRGDVASLFKYEGWNFNSGNYLFTTDTK